MEGGGFTRQREGHKKNIPSDRYRKNNGEATRRDDLKGEVR